MLEPSINTNDVRKEADELKELVRQVRSKLDLPPIFKSKRKSIELEDNEKSSVPAKKIMIENTIKSNTDSREDLMSRLSTYSSAFHFNKRPVSALDCAKHGWKDTQKTTNEDPSTCVLSCDTCKNNISILAFKHKANESIIKQVKKEYEIGLATGHKEDCQWRYKKCDDSVYCFPLVTISSGLEKFKLNANNIISACIKNQQALPTISHSLDDKTLRKIKYFADLNDQKQQLDNIETAYILSLHGWESLHPNIPGVKCDLCCTRIGFYLLNKDKPFDVLNQHKYYCPYVNPNTANAYTPKGFSLTKTQKISGSDWMKDVLSLEYVILVKKRDLSLTYEDTLDKKIRELQNSNK